MDQMVPGQARDRQNSAQFAATRRIATSGTAAGDDLAPLDPKGPRSSGSRTKCTEPVAPSSGFPTDLRRSDCLSGSHQPWTLRTRCNHHPRGVRKRRQGRGNGTLRKLRHFVYTQGQTAIACVCSSRSNREKKKRAGREGPAARKFAEPGTLSSTFPTNLPLPRSAPRGASSYRRPVLGAGGIYVRGRVRSRGAREQTSRNLRRSPPACLPARRTSLRHVHRRARGQRVRRRASRGEV